ncbi:MAG: ATP-binding protein [Niabella sp.]
MKSLLTAIAFFSMFSVLAQQAPNLNKLSTIGAKIDAWQDYCNELLPLANKGIISFQKLAEAAEKGIAILPPDSIRAKAMFSLFAGIAYETLKQYEKATTYFVYALDVAIKIKSMNYQVLAITRLDNIYSYTNNTAMRKQIIAKAKAIADTTTNDEKKLDVYDVLAGYYRDINNYDSSIVFRLKRIDLYKMLLEKGAIVDTINLGYSYTNLAAMYNDMSQYNKALEYLYEGSSIIGNQALTGGEETLYLYFMDAYSGLKNTDSLLKYYRLINTKMAIRDTLYNVLTQANTILGSYYSEMGNEKNAYYFAMLAYKFSKKSPNANDRIQANTLYADLLYGRQQYREAISVLNNTLQEDFEFNKQLSGSIHQILSESFAGLQQWDSAYAHLKQFSDINESILKAAANKNIADAEAVYQNREKRLLIETKNIQLKSAATQRFWLLLGLALAALTAALLFVIYRNKKKTNAVLDANNKELHRLNINLDEANKTKAKLFGIISHDLRSPINQVYQFLQLQQLNPAALSETQKTELNNKIQMATGSLLETMEDLLLWSKTQMNEFTVNQQSVLVTDAVNPCLQLLELSSQTKNIQYQINIPQQLFVETDASYLQTILRNLLQNAIKASPQSGKISIDATKTNDRVIISIENTGAAFTQEQYLQAVNNDVDHNAISGLGLKLTYELSEKINAVIYFTNPREHTTKVLLQLPG